MMFRTRDALNAMYVGGANCRIENEQITIWREDFPQPTEEAIQAKIVELQADYDSKQYQRDRLEEYPSIEECIHAILDDDLEALQAKRTAVKAKYPKPQN